MAKRKPRKYPVVSAATFIGKSRAVASEQKAIWNNETRPFFDVNDSDKEALRDGLARLVGAHLNIHQS